MFAKVTIGNKEKFQSDIYKDAVYFVAWQFGTLLVPAFIPNQDYVERCAVSLQHNSRDSCCTIFDIRH